MDLNDTLTERGAIYGDYEGGNKLRSEIMLAITKRYAVVNSAPMDHINELYIFDIVNKLSRLAASPTHVDSWHDIAGYAKLTEEILDK